MKSKLFTSLTLSIFALVLCSSLVSATVVAGWDFELGNSNPSTDLNPLSILTVNAGTVSYTPGSSSSVYAMASDGWDVAGDIEISVSTAGYEKIYLKFDEQTNSSMTSFIVQYSSDGVIFNNLTSGNLNTAFTSHTFDLTSISDLDNNPLVKIKIVPNDLAGASADILEIDNLRVEGTKQVNFCGLTGNPGELDLDIKEITVTGFGEDEEWLPLDEIEVEIEVDNKGDFDVEDIELEWGLYDPEADVGEEWIIDFEKEDDFDLDEDDEKTVTLSFAIDDDLEIDLDELNNDYILYVQATGMVDYKDIDDEPTCVNAMEEVSIEIEQDFVILKDLKLSGETFCDSEIEVTAEIWNIGDDDQEDVTVTAYNKELGIDEVIVIGDVDAFEDEKLSFTFRIPKNAEEKLYHIALEVLDEDEEVFENDYDDDLAEFTLSVDVEGNCIVEPDVVVTADLEEGGKPGEELVIKTTVVNSKLTSKEFIISAEGYEEWAESIEISDDTVVLGSGESAEILLTFLVNEDAEGEQTFDVKVFEGSDEVLSQPVSVTLESGGFSLPSIFKKDNAYLWAIGALNIILVVVIVLIAIKVSRRQ